MVESAEGTCVETEYVKIWIADGILFLSYLKENVDMAYARNVVETRIKLSKGKAYPIIVNLDKVRALHLRRDGTWPAKKHLNW